ncbi:predicted protein [Nematostella vectensis]|uniref:F5/8 type C domain-containing protein n=1 Tax=Nematostella vectensis TaxID=45351 RepID=A7SE92_NEMVE|nr:predicted protein [Nematostella vectensis]|eukprot:XP_001630057.1 predicted protein [Nematostella vectensis]
MPHLTSALFQVLVFELLLQRGFLFKILGESDIEKVCNDAAGIGSRELSDSNMTSSSAKSPNSTYGPQQAKLHSAHSWCAAQGDTKPYLEILLGIVRMIKYIATQGNPTADQFVTSFSLESSVIQDLWITYVETGARKIVRTSTDTQSS